MLRPQERWQEKEQKRPMVIWGMLLLAASLPALEQAVLDQVNAHRRAAGLNALAWNERAAAEARAHCGRLLMGRAAGPHDGFEGRAARLRRGTRARRAGENVFLMENGPFRAERAVEAWLESEGHRSAIEGPYQMTGVAVVTLGSRACAAQIFLGR